MERADSKGKPRKVRNEIRVNGKLEPDLPNDPFKIALILRERRSGRGKIKAKMANDLRARGHKV